MSQLDSDAYWDYQHPDQTEAVFRRLLEEEAYQDDCTSRLQLLTQIARAQGLQRHFVEAHQTLDIVKSELTPELVVPTVRYLLERGRLFNSAGQPSEATSWFHQAWDLARIHEEATFFAIDAAHMLAIVVGSFAETVAWNTRALRLAQTATDEQARGWCGSLYNNLGWTYHEQGEYEQALAYFQQAEEWQHEHGNGRERRIARWCIGRTLRSLHRTTEALALQQDLLTAWKQDDEEPDGYVFEEIAECLYTLGQITESQSYFAQAYARLCQDQWLVVQESARVERLQQLSQPTP
ncbi:MAG TPA: tetratricopeptide repeat protein [Ktedonobacteraceae bacterium]|nr:tetratricopeptide repeat protein [Ktedonobacteraceae bacterium]